MRPKKRRPGDVFKFFNGREGLEINTVRHEKHVSWLSYHFTSFDDNNVFISTEGSSSNKEVSVVKEVYRINRYK